MVSFLYLHSSYMISFYSRVIHFHPDMKCMTLSAPILYVSHQTREPQRKLRNIGHEHQYGKNSCKIDQELLHNSLNLYSAHFYTYKQSSSNRRGNRSDTQVEDHHNSKMYGIHSQCLAYRQENRCKDQAGRRHIQVLFLQ